MEIPESDPRPSAPIRGKKLLPNLFLSVAGKMPALVSGYVSAR